MSTVILNAEESRKAYVERKNQVLELLNQTVHFYEQEDDQDKAAVFSKFSQELENGEFSIVVVGEFSAGKSTLLNALMGRRILPSFSNETTATVNFLRHVDKAEHGEAGRVYYHDGNQEVLEEASLDTIMKYVSTKGDDVAKKIDHLDLYLDSDFLKDGVTLVDSPGLNGVADGHREITEEQILKSHASIFLFNSDHPGSKTDFEFLNDLQSKVRTIIFVLNKIDAIKAEENETPETVIDTLKQTYKNKFPEATTVPEIWPIAAYPALVARNEDPLEYHDKVNRTEEERNKLEQNSRLKAFEDRLFSFLTCGEKTKQQLLAPVQRVSDLALETRKKYEEEINLLKNAVDTEEIDDQIIAIQESMEELEKKRTESKIEISSKIEEILRDIREETGSHLSRLQDRTIAKINEYDDLDELKNYQQSFEGMYIRKAKNIVSAQEENLKDRILYLIRMQFSAQASAIEEKIWNNNSDIKISISKHLDTEEEIAEVGLKGMDEKEKELEEKIKKLEKEAEKTEEDFYRGILAEGKIKEKKCELEKLRERKNQIEFRVLPEIDKHMEEVVDYKKRKGLGGFLLNRIGIQKKVVRHELVTDSTIHDKAKAERDEDIKKVKEDIEELQLKIKSKGEINLHLLEKRSVRKNSELSEARDRLKELTNNNREEMEKKNNKNIRNLKSKLEDYCDEINDEVETQIKKEFRRTKHDYIELVLDMVEANVKNVLKEKEMLLEKLKKQLNDSEENRKERIDELGQKIEKINVLLEAATDLESDLCNMPVDQIKQETL